MISMLMRFGGCFSMIFGLMMVAGSGNDCDGKCMENANTVPEMLMVAGIGFALMIGGYYLWKKGEQL